jgi:hypothetical protein
MQLINNRNPIIDPALQTLSPGIMMPQIDGNITVNKGYP